MDGLERRSLLECRVEAVDNRRLAGYAIVFGAMSQDLGGFREFIAPAAVDRTLSQALDVRALVDHDSGKVIGRTRSGTLALRKDTTGLYFTVEPDPSISYAGDIMKAVKRGDVSGMSFGFRTISDEWNYEGEQPIRTVTDMTVSEISIVTFPAYAATDVAVAQRSLAAFCHEQRHSRIAFLGRKLQTAMR